MEPKTKENASEAPDAAQKRQRPSSHDIARLQVETLLTENTIRAVFDGRGNRVSRALVAKACRKLGIREPAPRDREQEAT